MNYKSLKTTTENLKQKKTKMKGEGAWEGRINLENKKHRINEEKEGEFKKLRETKENGDAEWEGRGITRNKKQRTNEEGEWEGRRIFFKN